MFFLNIIRWLGGYCSRVLAHVVEGLHRIYDVPIFIWTCVAACIVYAFHWAESVIFHLIGKAISAFLNGLSLITPSSFSVGEFANFFIDCFALDDFVTLLLTYLSILFLAKQMHFVGFVIKQVMRIIP